MPSRQNLVEIMLTKLIVILLSATVVLAFNIRITPDELREFVEEIGETIKTNEHEAQIDIRDNLIPLVFTCVDAITYIQGNLTELAKPYWDEIASIEKEAAGQNISACIELGNNQLYTLNATTVDPLIQEVNVLYAQGNQTLSESSAAVYKPVEELLILELEANECSDNECADALKIVAIDLSQNASDTIDNALSAAHDYVFVDLPGYLAKLTIDGDVYVKNYTSYLNDVKTCINDLVM